MNVEYVEKIINNYGVLEYKLLSIGHFTYNGEYYVQVHCDRKDIEFSELYSLKDIKYACHKYVFLYNKYKYSEVQYGQFVPIDKERILNVSKQRHDRDV